MSDQQAHGVPHIHVQLVDAERVQAHGPSQPAAQPLSHATHASVMPAHHDPHAPLKSDAVRHGMHDGTMYAQGKSLSSTGEPTWQLWRQLAAGAVRAGESALQTAADQPLRDAWACRCNGRAL